MSVNDSLQNLWDLIKTVNPIDGNKLSNDFLQLVEQNSKNIFGSKCVLFDAKHRNPNQVKIYNSLRGITAFYKSLVDNKEYKVNLLRNNNINIIKFTNDFGKWLYDDCTKILFNVTCNNGCLEIKSFDGSNIDCKCFYKHVVLTSYPVDKGFFIINDSNLAYLFEFIFHGNLDKVVHDNILSCTTLSSEIIDSLILLYKQLTISMENLGADFPFTSMKISSSDIFNFIVSKIEDKIQKNISSITNEDLQNIFIEKTHIVSEDDILYLVLKHT